MKPIYKQIASAVLLLVVGILGGNVAPPILPKPGPEPSPVVRVKPVSCIVTKDGKRIESQPISDIAANEADGVHEVLCIPPLGNPIVRRTITVATEGVPVPQPPRPITPVDPQPQPKPDEAAKVKTSGFRALMLYESASGVPIAFSDKDVRDYLTAKCATGQDGKTAEWRCWDDDLDPEAGGGDFPTMIAYRKAAAVASLPWVHCGNGTIGYDGPATVKLPDGTSRDMTGDELLALFKRYGG